MANEVMILAAQIVISHASMTELTTKELVKEIKEVYGVLASLAGPAAAPAAKARVGRPRKPRKVKMVESPVAKAIEDEDGPVLGDPDYIEFMDSREG